MPQDKWGIPYWYATKSTAGVTGKGVGFFWELSNNFRDDEDAGMLRLGKETAGCVLIDPNTGEWEFPYDTTGTGLDLSGPTGHHTGGETHGCEGFTYMFDSDWTSTPAKFRFRKETYHVQYDNDPQTGTPLGKEWTHPLVNYKITGAGWQGMGYVRYNKKDGRGPGKDSVVIEAWWNPHPDVDIKDWTRLMTTEDKGDGVSNWGVAATCDGEAHQVGTWSNIQFRFKSGPSDFSLHPLQPETNDGPNIHSIGEADMSFADSEARGYGYRADMPRDVEMKCLFKIASSNNKVRFKCISIREIDPTKSFDDEQNNPPPGGQPEDTTEVKGFLKLLSDINNVVTSACAGTGGGGGGGGGSKFYSVYTDQGTDQDKELADSSTWQNRKRLTMSPANNSSIFKGKIPLQLDIPLKRSSTAPLSAPTVGAKIWDENGNVIYTSPTTFDPSVFTTSFVSKTFSFSTNTHALVPGDRIGIEYTGGDSDQYVIASYIGSSYANTTYEQYEGTTWQSKSRRLVMDVWN